MWSFHCTVQGSFFISWHNIEQFFKRKVIDVELWLWFSLLWSQSSLSASISFISWRASKGNWGATALFVILSWQSRTTTVCWFLPILVDVPISDTLVVSRGKNKNFFGILVDFVLLLINVSMSVGHTVIQLGRAFWISVTECGLTS